MLKTVEIENNVYRIGKLNAFDQLDVSVKLSPLLLALSSGRKDAGVNDDDKAAIPENAGELSFEKMLKPLTKELAQMPRADLHFVINTCLSVVQRQVAENKWVGVMPSPGRLQFSDIEMPLMMRLSYETVIANMSGFFSAALTPGELKS